MSGYVLAPRDGVEPGGFGYRPPRNLLGDFGLKLDPMFLLPNAGWFAQPLGSTRPVPLGALLPNGFDAAILPTLSGFARDMSGPNPLDPAQSFARNLQAAPGGIPWDKIRDFVGERAKSALWTDLGVRGTRNVVTGEAATVGKIEPAGFARPDGVDESTVAGSGLDTRYLSAVGLGSGALSLGKRFRSASDTDVSLILFVDTDAYPEKMRWLFGGAGANFEAKNPDGTVWSLKVGGGRDQEGGLGVFGVLGLSIGDKPKPKPGR